MDQDSDERQRWLKRLKALGVRGDVFHVVFASSFLRGWGEREHLEGIQILCRSVEVSSAPSEFRGREYHRPMISAGDED